ncbi:ABC transporter permease [Microlunatus soli]|uniref:Peptide/nickel transport system permease protein n=1 Tax=Microlunatus soli TaxID=630515 RepID=A0A1H1RDU6_9ACTN|nr:ABC transporter permease [Microlunatus soli]SDS33934.1 peptide/nickel transport system permease protein [Microlunatus soli]
MSQNTGEPGTTGTLPVRRRRTMINLPSTWRQPLSVIGVVIIVLWALIAVFAPLIQPYDPLAQVADRLRPPSGDHLLGTDSLGRDLLSRIIAGSRITLPVALIVVVASAVVGITVGAIAGYFGRVIDEVLMRITDLVFAFPTIILAMVITAALGPGIQNAILAMLLVSWPSYARVTRSLVLGARESDYVVAGRLLGRSIWASLLRDILPNVITPLLVLATMDFGSAILTISGLSFLGLGTVPPSPEWGALVSEGVGQFSYWWIAVFSGMAIFTVVIAFNFVGDALRDSLDPRTQESVRGQSI